MSARPSRPGREPCTFTLAPITVARLSELAKQTGLSRGLLLDRAVNNMLLCPTCDGTGLETDTAECVTCAGLSVVPAD